MESVFWVLVVCQILRHLEVLYITALNIYDVNVQIVYMDFKGSAIYTRSSLPIIN